MSELEIKYPTKEEWLEARRCSIGSSDAPVIIRASRYKSLYTLWAEKSGLIELSQEETEAMRWGIILEPLIADEYAAKTGRMLIDRGRRTVLRHKDIPYMVATLDREIYPSTDRPAGVLELKSTSAFFSRAWDDEPPLIAQVQLQHQLAVTGFQWGSVAGLIGGQQFKWTDLERDNEFIEMLLEAEYKFWRAVQTGIPPEVDDSDSTAETLKDLYKRDSGRTIFLPGIAIDWDDELQLTKAEIKRLSARKQELENRLKAEIKDASTAMLDNGVRYTLKEQHRAAYTVEATSFRVLRRSEKK